MRISTSQIFSQSLNQINSSLADVAKLNAMNSSQKKLNSPSDNPFGMGTVIELRTYDKTLSGYLDNCDAAASALSLADSILLEASEIITAARELAEQGATETYTATQLTMMAEEMAGYLDSLMTMANAQLGTDSVFAGNALNSSAYKTGLGVTLTNDTLSNASFVAISGELDSLSISVRLGSDGVVGTDELDYSYSTDGGNTWTSATLAAGDTVFDLGSCAVELSAGTAVTQADDDGNGTGFIVRAAVVYTGSDTAMTVAISESSDVAMTTVGSDIFGGLDGNGNPYGDPNLFEIVADCIACLANGDHAGVAENVEALRQAQEHLEAANANIGARENRISYTSDAISRVRSITTNAISGVEDADAAQILVELEQANYIYEAVLTSSASIMRMSLLDYV